MATKTGDLRCYLEPQLKEAFIALASKSDMTPSAMLRAMVIDALRFQGLLPESSSYDLLKGMVVNA